MRKFFLLLLGPIAIIIYAFFSCRQGVVPSEKMIAQTLSAQVDSFAACKDQLLKAVEANSSQQVLQDLFLKTRLAYKKFEWAAEYFSPATSRFVNGPPVQEIEMTGGQIFEPAGLQVIEGYLFPQYDLSSKKELIRQLKLLQSGCDKYKTYFNNIDLLNWQILDASKQEVFRVLTLGITGFDNPLTLKSSEESLACMQSIHRVLEYYTPQANAGSLLHVIDGAEHYLATHKNFNSFDRARFITQYGNPISAGIAGMQSKLNLQQVKYNRLLNQDAKTLFDVDAFNANAFAPDVNIDHIGQKVALGKRLFSDGILSGNGKRSCQSCHQPEKAFTDGLAKNTVLGSSKPIKRNTPTLLNAALQPMQFYDLRVNTLEDQSRNVVNNTDEMHGSMKVAAHKLWQDNSYRRLFASAFPKKNRTEIDTLEVMSAIGSYVRSLVRLNSRFDEYMRGNHSAMNTSEINGFNLFMGKAKCATCHYMPLFNGTFPPRYAKIESEVIGVPEAIYKTAIDTDMGRYNVIQASAFKHAFKTVTVRNAALTAPYMHNGVFNSLEQVIDFYNKGGGPGLGIKVDNLTLQPGKLNLSNQEQADIIAFIKALNSR
jgi:cytochrome c peroxidase